MADILKQIREKYSNLGSLTGECVSATLSSSSVETPFSELQGYKELSISTRGDEDAELRITLTLDTGDTVHHEIFGGDFYNYVIPPTFGRISNLHMEEITGRTIKIKANLSSRKL